MTQNIKVLGSKLVASGACLARCDSGEIIFVDELLPGETAWVEETKTKGKTKFGKIVSIEEVSKDRVDPPCIYVASGCGGCDWQHISVEAQHQFKRDIVVDALTRIGKVPNAENLVSMSIEMKSQRYRTSARILADAHSWGFRADHSHDMVRIEDCLVMHPECIRQAQDVVVAIGNETHVAETLDEVEFVDSPPSDEFMDDEIHEAHVRRAPDVFREINLSVSQKSFFQGHIDAPMVLSDLVLSKMNDLGEDLVCVDLYSGVGVFAIALAQAGHRVIAVEGNPYAVGDAHKNLDGLNATVVHSDVKKFRFDSHSFGDKCDLVVADPSREGITKEAIEAVVSCKAQRVILISCDPAAGARDISLLCGYGYALAESIPLDMFGHTHHVEMVSVLNLQ